MHGASAVGGWSGWVGAGLVWTGEAEGKAFFLDFSVFGWWEGERDVCSRSDVDDIDDIA